MQVSVIITVIIVIIIVINLILQMSDKGACLWLQIVLILIIIKVTILEIFPVNNKNSIIS